MDTPLLWPITVIGPGAIGLHLALWLSLDHPVELRHPTRQGTVQVQTNRGQPRALRCRSLTDPTPVRHALITTKAYQAVGAFRQIEGLLTDTAEIVLCHNGMGPQNEIAQRLGKGQQLGVATTTNGVRRVSDTVIEDNGSGETWLGPWTADRDPGELESALIGCGLTVHWEHSAFRLAQRVWNKLLINAIINSWTAVLDVPNGALSETDHQPRWRPMLPELAAIASAEGFPASQEQLADRALAVISATAGNRSSMQQDFACHRRPEIDAITGFLLRRAQTHKLCVPALRDVHEHLLKKLAGPP